MHAAVRDVKYKNTAETFEAVFFVCFDSDTADLYRELPVP
jgi:hypothetical protein